MTSPAPHLSPWPEIEPPHRTSYGSSGRQEFTAACVPLNTPDRDCEETM